jgi:DNA invertase Pin-like site-specific DNA recombinase
MRSFLYARVSTNDKGQDSENQMAEMRRCVEFKQWKLRREFVDEVTGSGKKVREQFDEMLEACERHEADIVIIWALDRFSREGPLKTLLLLDRLQRAGVKVKSMKEPWLDPDSPTYELLVPIFAWIAKQERIRIGERVKAGMANARDLIEKGLPTKHGKTRWAGRPRIEFDRAVIASLRRKGWSLRSIAAHLDISEGSVRNALKSSARPRKKGVENRP